MGKKEGIYRQQVTVFPTVHRPPAQENYRDSFVLHLPATAQKYSEELIVKAPMVDIFKDEVALKDSFAEDGVIDDIMLEEMANRWVGIEDDPDVIEEEVAERSN